MGISYEGASISRDGLSLSIVPQVLWANDGGRGGKLSPPCSASRSRETDWSL